jgi:hypothetical protein
MDSASFLLSALMITAILLLLWPLARSAGRAEDKRMRALVSDLRRGRARGIYVVLAVAALIAITQIDHFLRN